MNIDDFVTDVVLKHPHAHKSYTGTEWTRAIKGSGLTQSEIVAILDGFHGAGTPADLTAAKRRMKPVAKCPHCDGTGQVWDEHTGQTDPYSGAPGSWVRCICPEGDARPIGAGRLLTSSKLIPTDEERTMGLDAIRMIRKQRMESTSPWAGRRWGGAA